MLYPSVQDLTNNDVNRYMLVIAAAKGARYITYKQNQDEEYNDRYVNRRSCSNIQRKHN